MSRAEAYADRTVAAYRMRAGEAARNWSRIRVSSPFLREFAGLLPPGARVLDYGCGTGQELAWLARRGFRAEGVDGTLEFVLRARKLCPQAKVLHARFEAVPLGREAYGGVWCNAALIHVPPEEMAAQLEKLRRALSPGGWLALTLAWGSKKGFLRRDWIPGRYMACYSRAETAALLEGWEVRSMKVVSKGGRRGRWIRLLAQPRR